MSVQKIVCVRSQPAKGKFPRQGPDAYVAVQVVPDGVEPLRILNRVVAQKRGIEIVYFGEGYSNHRGPNSALGRAIKEARAYADSFEDIA